MPPEPYVETVYDPLHGIFNGLFSTAAKLFEAANDGSRYPLLSGL